MAFHYQSRGNKRSEPYTLISDWLIDSGCTAQMTLHLQDFVSPLEDYETMVETANGGLARVRKKGVVKVLIIDKSNPDKRKIV